MSDLKEIERLARAYATERRKLADSVSDLTTELAAAKRKQLPTIRRAVARVADQEAALRAALEAAPGLFAKPRTHTFDGIRVGFAKGKGGLSFEDGGRVVALIRKHFPEQFDVLVKVTETPLKGPLAQLEVRDLKRLGVAVTETGDQPVIKAVDGEVEKLVDALLKEAAKADGGDDD